MITTRRDPWLVAALVSGALFVLLAIVVQQHALRDVDLAILRQAEMLASLPLDVTTRLLSYFGSVQWSALAAILLIAWWRGDRRWAWAPLLLFAIIAIEFVLKIGIDDPPPPAELRRHVRPTIEWLPRLPQPNLGRLHEFPSGHTARAAFLAVITAARWPKATIPLAIIAGLMVFTRIYNGSHFMTAAVGGALLGIAVGCAGVFLARRAHNSPA